MTTRFMSIIMALLFALSSIQLPVYAEEIVVQEENENYEVMENIEEVEPAVDETEQVTDVNEQDEDELIENIEENEETEESLVQDSDEQEEESAEISEDEINAEDVSEELEIEELLEVEEVNIQEMSLMSLDGWVEVSTYDELKDAFASNEDVNVRLTADIESNDYLNHNNIVTGTGDYALDLNGYDITRFAETTDGSLFEIYGNFILKNTQSETSRVVVKLNNFVTAHGVFCVNNGAVLTVEDDDIEIYPWCTNLDAILIEEYGTAYIKGGSFGTDSTSSGVYAKRNSNLYITGGKFLGIIADRGSNITISECEVLSNTTSSSRFIGVYSEEEYGWLAPGQNIYINGIKQDLSASEAEVMGKATESWKFYYTGQALKTGDVVTISDGSVFLSEEALGQCGVDLTWKITKSTGELIISGTGTMYDYDDERVTTTKRAPWHDYKNLIKSVVIRDGVTYIGNYAFDECKNITNFEVPWSVKSLGTNICDCDSGMNSFFRVKYYGSEMQWKRMVEATSSNNELKDYDYFDFRSYGGKIGENVYWNLNNDDNILIIYGSGPMYDSWDRGDTSLHFTDFNTRDIEEAIIEEGVTTIGEEAFCHRYSSQVKKLYVAASVKEIKNDAFYYCTKLSEVTFAPNSQLKSIGEYAFSNTNLTNIVLPEGLETIGDAAFYESNLKEVTIPTTVTSIGSGAFNDTDLTKVIYNGTQEQWEQINIDSSNPDLFSLIEGFVRPHTHIGGKATCKKKAICEICGIEYGEIDPDAHDLMVNGVCDPSKDRCSICGKFNINMTLLDKLVVSKDKNYTGNSITSDVTITNLVKDVDYTVENVTKTEPGKYEVIIKGIGDFVGERVVYWQILPAKGLWFANITDQTYSGKAIKPVMDVYCDGVLLTAGKDYTITYGKYNTNVAAKDAMSKGKSVAPSVTVTGKGNYSEKKTMTFSIVPLSVDTATVNDILVAKSGKAIKVAPSVKLNGKTLKLGTEYVVSTTTDISGAITSLKDPGQYDLYVVGKGNYTGYAPFRFTITEKILASKVTIDKIANQNYDGGNKVEPAVKITYNKKDKTADFDIVYKNNTEIGTATVTITAKSGSEFIGTKSATFKIIGTQISGAKLGVDGKGTIPAHIYDGKPYEPSLDLYVGTTKLIRNTDYTVTYAKNVNVGTATATVVGKGKYTGSKKFSYKISKYDATADSNNLIKVNEVAASGVNISVKYEKGGVTPKPVVKFGNIVLKEKTDYTLSYANNKAVAAKDAMNSKGKDIAPTMTITFKGNLAGKQIVKFAITKKNIDAGKITIADKAYSTKANAWKQTAVTIVDTNGKKLVAGTDYSKIFKYYSNSGYTNEITDITLQPKTTVYVEVTGINNYDGSVIRGSYRISEKNLAKVSTSIDSQTFTGSEICPTATDIKVWVGSGKTKTYLTPGIDYDVVPGSYTKNTNKGTATVTIVGKNDYYGTKVVKFSIGAKKFLWWELP